MSSERARASVAHRWPRAVTFCLGMAILRHGWTAVSTAGTGANIGPIDWTLLAVAELALLLVALHVPTMFQLRRFRLAGVAVSANALVVLFPLPEVMAVYDRFVPGAMIISIAAGLAAMALVFLVMARWASSSVTAHRGSSGLLTSRASDGPGRPLVGFTRNERILPVAILTIAVIALPLWFATAGVPPLFSLLGAGSGNLAAERQAALSQLDQPMLRLVFGMLRNLLLMFAAGWFVATAASTPREMWRRRSTAEITAIAGASLGIFFAVLTTERAIAGELVVVCAVAFLVVRGRELSARFVPALAGIALLFPLAVGLLGGAGGLLEVIVGLRRRALYLPAEVMTRYFIEFPLFHDFLRGASVPKLSYLTGGETFDLSQHIYLRYYQRDEAIVGNANGSLFGVGWANFGPGGVVFWAVITAVTLVLLDRWIDRLPVRSSAALRGLGVVLAVLTTSADVFRSVLGFAPGFLDLVLLVGVVAWIERRRSVRLPGPPGRLASPRQQVEEPSPASEQPWRAEPPGSTG